MSSSEELHKRRTASVARGVGSTITSYVDRASGGTLTDVDGREWIDFGSGIAVTSVGHAAPRVVAAVREQVGRFTHTCFMVAPYEGYVAVGRRRVRPRLPRPDHPHDGADREVHAVQAPVRTVRAGDLPGADVLPAA